MSITEGVDKKAGGEIAFLCDHEEEEGVACDVEGNSDCDIGGTLVKLEVEVTIADVELEKSMAGGEGHLVDVGDIPGINDDSAGIWVGFNHLNGICKLINMAFFVVLCLWIESKLFPVAPLVAIDGPEASV